MRGSDAARPAAGDWRPGGRQAGRQQGPVWYVYFIPSPTVRTGIVQTRCLWRRLSRLSGYSNVRVDSERRHGGSPAAAAGGVTAAALLQAESLLMHTPEIIK